ncbi:MAG: hypothetical protein EBW84_11790 [Betaproteobacteria bacterium]|nr:hypothetical protein [Betaproteobacteria bacterium]
MPEDRWFPLAVARTRITMRWAASLSVLGVGLAIWLERGASMGLAAFALLLGLIGLALHQSVARRPLGPSLRCRGSFSTWGIDSGPSRSIVITVAPTSHLRIR